MHLPIQEAISYPVRLDSEDKDLLPDLDWAQVGRLDFEALDVARFPCFRLALEAARRGGTFPAALVGADEAAVAMFLRNEIGLMDISRYIERVLREHEAVAVAEPDLDAVLAACAWARTRCESLAKSV
jgi:1-deoxy-D-xylulose-5-phosphate reductoisomerase